MVEPFGTNDELANPLNVGQHFFMGLTVVDVNCTSSWTPEGGQCVLRLVQDTNQYLQNVVIGSPQYFEIISVDNLPIFRFYGILIELSRVVSPAGGKMYTAVLQSPTVLLEACGLIFDKFAGVGGATEATGANVPTCLDFGSLNGNINTTKIYNLQNLYGVYENDSYGFPNEAAYGNSIVNNKGMRIDLFARALNELLNGNVNLTPQLGSNIIFGADGYFNNNAYAYNFDVYGFLNQIINFIPYDYRVSGTNLMEVINQICTDINFIFYIDLLKPPGAGSSIFGLGHLATTIPAQTHAGTVYGGQIVVITQNRNTSAATKFPLSAYVVGRERSDKLGGIGQVQDLPLDIGMVGDAHPDGPPFASSPFGGEFPVESITVDNVERYTDTSLKVKLNPSAVGARYIVGGFQSRINYVTSYGINQGKTPEIVGSTCTETIPPDIDLTPDVFCYWGDLNISSRVGYNVPNVPVITPILDDPFILDHQVILIDFYESFGDLTINNVIRHGVYSASVNELRTAMDSYDLWKRYMVISQPVKMKAIIEAFPRITVSDDFIRVNGTGELTAYGKAQDANKVSAWFAYNTDANNTNNSNPPDDHQQTIMFLNTIWEGVKKLAEEHYGKSFAVKCPAYTVKKDQDGESPLNSFTRSWDLAEDAYLDPINYANYEAPDAKFVKGGRLKAFANYYLEGSPYHSLDAEAFWYNDTSFPIVAVNYSNPDFAPVSTLSPPSFKNYSRNDVYIRASSATHRNLVAVPVDIDKEYILLPVGYFVTYNVASEFLSNAVDVMLDTYIPYNGEGCVPFVLAKTKGVFNVSETPKFYESQQLLDKAKEAERKAKTEIDKKSITTQTLLTAEYPKSFGIPQQSNRFVYGPWITDINLPYGTKIEYEQISDLVPESYIFPGTINIGGVTATIISGYEGMNEIGQLMANTVLNFDFLYTEEGSITIPGYPLITHIGEALIGGGPLVSDLSITISANTVSTTYNMSTFAPKFGRANKFVIDRLTQLAKRIENGRK
jgi:hypothetical protein